MLILSVTFSIFKVLKVDLILMPSNLNYLKLKKKFRKVFPGLENLLSSEIL